MAPRTPQDGTKIAQEGAKMRQDDPKIAENSRSEQAMEATRPNNKNLEKPKGNQGFWGSSAPRKAKKTAKLAPRWHQDGP